MPRKTLWAAALSLLTAVVHAQTDVLVSRYDAGRTSQNLSEAALSTQSVNVGTFGKVYSYPVDGQIYAQPLVKSNLTIPGEGTFNAVFVATQHSSVYAIDADTATPLWRRSFISPSTGLTTRIASGNEDISTEVSITSTPVIDGVNGTLYIVAQTVQRGFPAYYWLHALDMTTGADKIAPVRIQAAVGTGITPLLIDAATSEQRPGLVLSNGVVYLGFGSNGDNFPWVGWLVGYNATTLAQVSLLCTSPGGQFGSGVWSGGEAPPVDAAGNIYISTGNGYFNGTASWGDSILKLSTGAGLAVADYFTPFNQAALAAADLDLAAAGLILLPDAAGSPAHPHLLVTSGKDGEVYLIDRDAMGHYNGSYATPNTNIVQWIPNALGATNVPVLQPTLAYAANSFTSPAYWGRQVYFCGAQDPCKAFSMANGLLSTTPASLTPSTFGYPGSQPVISAANASATTAVLWAVERDATNNVAVLHAYDASNLATELYNSKQAANNRDAAAAPVKFSVPTVANGKVFLATQTEVDVYGLLAGSPQRLAAPTFTPAPSSYVGAQAVTLSASPGAQIYYTLDGSLPTLASKLYSAPLTVSATTTINAMAVQTGWLTSAPSVGTFNITAVVQIAYVQGNYATPQSPQSAVAVKYTAAQQQGDLNVVVVGWGDSSASVRSVSDASGNTYALATGPTVLSGVASQAVYYAPGIAGAAAGANSLTVNFNGSAIYPDIRIAEYSGVSASAPLDVGAGASGGGTSANSGSITTSTSGELIVGADVTVQYTYVGAGFTQRQLTVPDGDILEDLIAGAAGSYSAGATIAPAGAWIMQLAAFKPASGGVIPPVPTAPGALTALANGATGINLSWAAATESGGSIAQYLIERCQGAGCANFVQVGVSATTAYADAGLGGSKTYSYRVRAKDAAGNSGAYSGAATATTAAAVPGTPTNLAVTALSSTQLNLSWGAASEAGGTISQYLIERCQGSGCGTFTQIGTSTSVSFQDTGLSGSTNYAYRVRAKDSVGNTGAYSNIATATTLAVSFTAPANLTATSASSTQITLTWAAASETGGTVSQYRIERCQGAGCGTFAQVGTSTSTGYGDAGLTAGTSYTYRVRASDAASNVGPYSNTATAMTAPATVTITAPAGLSAVSAGPTQINLAWTAASETGGTISQYLVERCQGTGCVTFSQVGTSTSVSFSDTGLGASTSYSYRVRARDAAGNMGAYSNVATVSTAAVIPTAPSNLTAASAGPAQVNLAWGAASETGGTISQYLIERCQGSACATFTQIGTATSVTYSDTGLNGSTNYTYRVRARDAAGNMGAYSNTATTITAAVTFTAPANLTATSPSSTQINLTWSAAAETGGTISQYRIERCQGSGCGTFTQVATSATTAYNDAALAAATAYSYRVRASDAAGNLGPYSNIATASTATQGPPAIAFVQQNYADPQSPQSRVTVRFNGAQVAGDLNVVIVGWNDSTAMVGSISDSSGNTYRLAVGPTVISATASQSIYYASAIVGSAANTVTVAFTSAVMYPDVRALEYSGIDTTNPLDVTASGTGNSGLSASAAVTTTYANDLIVGANTVVQTTLGPGTGFTSRVITNPDADIAEDRIVSAIGSYSATAPLSPPAPWIMQLAAFRRHP